MGNTEGGDMGKRNFDRNVSVNKLDLFAKAFVNTSSLSKKEFIERAFNIAFELIEGAEKGTFFELDGDYFKPIYSRGYDTDALSLMILHKDHAFVDYENNTDVDIDAFEVMISSRNLSNFSDDMIEAMKILGTDTDFISLYAPLKVENEYVGIICFDNFSNQNYSDTSKTILKLYAQMFSNYYAMKLSEEKLKNKYEEIISSLVSAIELKDTYTKGHANRVVDLSLKLAKEYGVSHYSLENIEYASILHDVGKIGIPTHILTKPSGLSDEEYEAVKMHPEYARRILSEIEGFEAITELAYCHHEHYNGSGYPRGLKADQIPIEAQIIQICDTYDAMTSKRAYRDALTKEKALKIIEEERGKQFNPELVDLILELNI